MAAGKRLAFGIRNRFRIRQWYGLRILVNSADPIFVVQVRAGSEARLPDDKLMTCARSTC